MHAFYTHTADFERPTTTADAMGGQSKTFAVLHDDVQGSLQPIAGAKINVHDHLILASTHWFFTETDISDLRSGDRAVIDSVKYDVKRADREGGGNLGFCAYLERQN